MTDAGPRGLIPGGALAPSLRRPVAPTAVAAFPEVPPEESDRPPQQQLATMIQPAEPAPPGAPKPRATGPLGPAPAAPPPKDAPYGMRRGQRHLLPGISNLANPPPQLDTSGDYELVMPNGHVIPVLSRDSRNSRYSEVVKQLGQSLLHTAANPREAAIADAVTEWGQSMVGQLPIEDIQKVMAERWDHNVGNVVKRDLGHDRIVAAQANRGRGPAAGVGIDYDENGLPRANTQFGHTVLKDYAALVNQTINREVTMEGYKALTDHENQLDSMLDGITSPNAMDQRSAVMSRMLEKSGKASTDMERAQLNAAAGKWAEFKNNLSLYLSSGSHGAQMDQSFINQFAQMVKTDKATIARIKEETGRRAASTFKNIAVHPYGPQLAQEGADEVYRAFVGVGRGGEYEPPTPKETAGKLPTFRPSPPAATKPPGGAPAKAAPAPVKPPPKDANSHLD